MALMRVGGRRLLLGIALGLVATVLVVAGSLAVRVARIPDPPTRAVRLPSGAVVDFLDYGMEPEPPPTWHVDYRTRIPIHDQDGLAAEVAALWPDLQAKAEQAGYSRVVVSPTNFSHEIRLDGWRPVILSLASGAFCVQKDADGWHRTNGWPEQFRQH